MPDNGIAVEPREAQRPTSLAARTPQAATPGNRESPWVRGWAVTGPATKGAVAQHPGASRRFIPLPVGREGKREKTPPRLK